MHVGRPAATTGPAGRAGHFGFLDALRGLAALWVVLFHLTVSSTLPPVDDGGVVGFWWHTVLGHGGLGVAVFFVLSGFVIAHSLRRGLDSGAAVGSFLVRRVVRLTPPYWAAIVVAIAFHGLAVMVNHEPFAPGGQPLSVARVLSHLVYLEGLTGHRYINDVFWTLTVEMQFYLVLAALLVVAGLADRRHRLGFRAVVGAGAALSAVAALSGADPQATFVPLFYSFFLGAVLYWTWSRRLSRVELGLYLVALGVVFGIRPDSFLAASLITGILLALAGGVNRHGTSGLSRWLSVAPFPFLGRISYSLYLVHVPVQGAVLLAVVKVMGTGAVAVTVAAMTSTMVAVAASTVFWWAVERPAMAWASSLKRQPSAPAGAGGAGSEVQPQASAPTHHGRSQGAEASSAVTSGT